MPYEFYLSIDGKQLDEGVEYTAALVEKSGESGASGEIEYRAHALTAYADEDEDVDEIVDDVLDLIADEPFAGRTVLVTNVGNEPGRMLHGALRDRGASPLTIAVTHGETSPEQGRPLSFASSADEAVHVSKHEIVSSIERIYRSGRLDLESVKDHVASAMVRGLEMHQIEADVAVQEDEEIEGEADVRPDAVLAAGAAVWLAEQQSFDPTEHLAGDPPPVREPKREMRPDTA